MWLVFIGQNASTGSPHPITGHSNTWGHYKKFKTRKERDEYADEWRSYNPSEFCKTCGVKSGRKYCLGSSMRSYLEYLEYLPTTSKNGNKWEEC